MLVSLHVKNLALIDETEVYFGGGLNILTGETGAGKSIIIGSVNLALGARADKDMIRTGAEYALVELVFQVQQEEQLLAIKAMDIPMEEDGTLLIQRKIMPNRNVSKICGENATTKMLKDLAGILIDIHGQHEHQSLFHIKKHMELLDEFAKEELVPVKEIISIKYREYLEYSQKLDQAIDQSAKEKEISLAEFEIEEIERARIQAGEDDILEADYSRMRNMSKIVEAVGTVYRLTGYDSTEGAGGIIGRAVREMKGVLSYDTELESMDETLNTIDELLNDFNRNVADYISDMKFDEQDFRDTEERLNILNHLKSKYGSTLEDVLAYQEVQKEKLDRLQNYEQYKEKLYLELQKTKAELDSLCEKASSIRQKYAEQLSAKMTHALLDLNFLEVNFEIQVRRKEQYQKSGYDEVEFMISTNPGEPMKSLCNVASGGELSRIMLALKTVIAEKDEIETLVFDEIDAGISGKTAWKVSEQLAILGRNHQIICITHLPQIAAMADSHFVIAKKAFGGTTRTSIEEIKAEEEIKELARLLGGDVITEAVMNNAKEMKDLAVNSKQFESKF